ncbi:hypothetical protein RC74_21365 (plasmid) [Falsihalocynthiibacter arcticus]|uniref:Haemolysin-type calcium binding-related domain-containing protein n=1 Tax=Falsihalocynthiibacter arcticus TaxID=1579316 RepID=A0A126V750_9RHOB|nr:hypothetical protein RC74_21365 [Falsihalocynthiibacter arcticus]
MVLNDTIAGAGANSFFLTTATTEQKTITGNDLASVGLALMEEDLKLRILRNGADLSGDDYERYHREVFGRVAGVSAEAWTPTIFLDSFGDAIERQDAWVELAGSGPIASYNLIVARRMDVTNEYLDNTTTPLGGIVFSDLDAMTKETMLAIGIEEEFADWFIQYSVYLDRLIEAGFPESFVDSSNIHGPYGVNIPSEGTLEGGNHGSNELVGTSNADVLIGFDGNDTFVGQNGADRLYGGNGQDTANYSVESGPIRIQLGALQNGAEIEWAGVAEENDVQRVEGSDGEWDVLIDIEQIIGTSLDDVLELNGRLEDIGESPIANTGVDVGSNGILGDTIDLSGLSTDVGVNVNLDDSGLLWVRETDNMGIAAPSFQGYGFENVIGTNEADTIIGNVGDNTIFGGAGADTLEGGGGQDTIYFDADDTSVRGGHGYDVGYFGYWVREGLETDPTARFRPSENAAVVSLQEMELEVFVGGAGNDIITSTENTTVVLAGGDGIDTFNLESTTGAPTVVWGGEGADIVNITSSHRSTGIMAVQIDNVTEENIQFLDLDMLGLGSTFDWSSISAVIINPDAEDRFYINDGRQSSSYEIFAEDHTVQIEREGQQYGSITYNSFTKYPDFIDTSLYSRQRVGEFEQSFIGGYDGTVFTTSNNLTTLRVVEYTDIAGINYIQMLGNVDGLHGYEDDPLAQGLGFGGSGWNFESDYDYDLSSADFVSQWDNGTREHFFYADPDTEIGEPPSPWFIIGGTFEGSSLVENSSVVAPPGNSAVSLFSAMFSIPMATLNSSGSEISISLPDINPGGPRGGRYAYSTGDVALGEVDGTVRVADFDPLTHAVIVAGNPIDGTDLPEGVSISEVNGSVVINYLGDNNIVLRGITLADWQSGAQAQIHGTLDSDAISGSSAAEVIVGGDGDDTVNAGSGADLVYLGEGNDVLLSSRGNKVVSGGAGNDVISVMDSSTVDGGDGNDTLFGHLGKGGDHIFIGGSGADTFEFAYAGSKEADQIIVDFESGIDTLKIAGHSITGYRPTEIPSEFNVAEVDGNVVISYGENDVHSVTLENLTIDELLEVTEIPDSAVTGTSSDDAMGVGHIDSAGNEITNGANVILALDGDDILNAGNGDDVIFLGEGNDSLAASRGNKIVYGDAGNDTIAVIDSSVVVGGEGNDLLFGRLNKGGDHIFTGGTGADVFEFAYAGSKNTDQIITDFELGVDQLVFNGETLSGINEVNLPSTYSTSDIDGNLVIVYDAEGQHSVTLNGLTANEFFL